MHVLMMYKYDNYVNTPDKIRISQAYSLVIDSYIPAMNQYSLFLRCFGRSYGHRSVVPRASLAKNRNP